MPLRERPGLAKTYVSMRDETRIKTRALLGEDRFLAYERFEDTRPERTVAEIFRQTLGAGEELDSEREHSLIDRLSEQRDRRAFPTNCYGRRDWYPFDYSAAEVARHVGKLAELYTKYLAAAQGVLSESQLSQFKSFMAQEHARQEKTVKHNMELFPVPAEQDRRDPLDF